MKLFIKVKNRNGGGTVCINVMNISMYYPYGPELKHTLIKMGDDSVCAEESFDYVGRCIQAAVMFMFSGGAA